jgi:O-antigen ligase
VARKRRAPAGLPSDTPRTPAAAAARTVPGPASANASLPAEPRDDGWATGLLGAMVLLAPALGMPGEEMLQDTLKSIVVAFFTLAAALLFFQAQRDRREPLRWHGVVWLPLLLLAYALGSMAWSHTYLGGVESVRWFLFAVIAWLALNCLSRERLPLLAWCFHLGAVIASTWAILQFWTGMSLFPQGPNPASTFINRNFFAEYAVCTLPFGVLLLARARASAAVALRAASIGLVVTALLMTGTRGALIAMWLQFLVVLPLIAWRCRKQLAWSGWTWQVRALAVAVLVGTVLALGAIPTGNPKILDEERGASALARGMNRTQSVSLKDPSLGIRMVMWRATVNLIKARPITGVGAGAWESDIPLYQAEGSQLETDYYVHNEFLQLVAEYGVVGWLFLLLLAAYLLSTAWRTWRDPSPAADAERPLRGVLLCSLLALMVVSNIGFPWRLAATGALFALCLGGLAASDARLGYTARVLARPLRWSRRTSTIAVGATGACLLLALFITQQAAESERKLVSAAKTALSITGSGDPNNPRFNALKQEMLQRVRDGVAINRHYRKITPMVADELARWGDWRNATWIWDSVLSSRPYVVAIISNAARGYSAMGRQDKALEYLERARRIQPRAPSVRSLEVIILARDGQEAKAMQLAKEAMQAGIVDFDLVNAYYVLAWRAKDYPLALKLLERRMAQWPESRALGLVQRATLYEEGFQDTDRALASAREGLAAASPQERAQLLEQLPASLRSRLDAPPQTSATSR